MANLDFLVEFLEVKILVLLKVGQIKKIFKISNHTKVLNRINDYSIKLLRMRSNLKLSFIFFQLSFSFMKKFAIITTQRAGC